MPAQQDQEVTTLPSEHEIAMSLLSDEERAAYALEIDGDGVPANDEGDDEERGGDAPGEETGDGAAAAAADDAMNEQSGASDTAGAQDSPAAPETPEPARAQPMAAPYAYALPEDFQDQRAALDAKFTELDARLESGDVGSAEYGKELRALNKEEAQLIGMQQRAEIAAEMTQQAQEAAARRENAEWEAAVETLIKEIEADGSREVKPDYRNDAKIGQALGTQVQVLLTTRGIDTGVPVADKIALLRAADRALHFMSTGKALGVPEVPPTKKADGEVERAAKAKAEAERKISLKNAAPAISTVPGTSGELDTSEFSHMGGLEGEKLENAMANLQRRDPAAYKRYMETDQA